jgi:hypothetical protein
MAMKVTVKLDRTRTMMDGLYAQKRFVEVAGKKISDIEWDNALDLANRVWSLLVWEDPQLTVDDVARMVDNDNADEIFDSVLKAITGEETPLEESGSSAGPTDATTSA